MELSTEMIIASVVLLFSGLLAKPAPVFGDVYVGNHGPYRFLVDTGAEISVIDPKLAAELELRPEFRVEVITPQSKSLAPGLKTRALRLGDRALPEMELLFHDVTEARQLDRSVRGVLGLNALAGLDFTLVPGVGTLDLAAERPEGEVVPFDLVEGRIAVKARMGQESLTLILDSGSSHVVLFRVPAAMAKTRSISSTFTTLDGARRAVPTTWTADMLFADHLRVGVLPAAIVERTGTLAAGLLPASVFKKIYVDQTRRELVLVR